MKLGQGAIDRAAESLLRVAARIEPAKHGKPFRRCHQLTDEPSPNWSSFLVLNWTFLKGRLSVTLLNREEQRAPASQQEVDRDRCAGIRRAAGRRDASLR